MKNVHKSLTAEVGFALYTVGMSLRREGSRCSGRGGMTPEQAQVLMVLSSKGPMSQKMIGEITIQDPATLSRIIKRLEAAGMVKKTGSEKDRRETLITITPKGIKTGSEISRASGRHFEKLFTGFSDNEKNSLISLLNKLKQCIDKEAYTNREECR